jgi:hypothetical protein
MTDHRLPDLDVDLGLGRVSRLVKWGVRLTLVLAAGLAIGAAFFLLAGDLAAFGPLRRLLAGGGG